MPATRIDPKTIEGWLRDIGLQPQPVPDPATLWRFNFQFPAALAQPHVVSVLNPLQLPRAVIIASGASLAPEHHAAFNQLEEDAKQEFIRDLHGTLNNRDNIEFMLQGVSDQAVTCPTAIQVTGVIFDDGLSLDNLASRLCTVYKAEVAGFAFITRHIGPTGTSGSGQFDFKRLGGLQ